MKFLGAKAWVARPAGCQATASGRIVYTVTYPGTGFEGEIRAAPAELKERPHTLLKVIEYYEELAAQHMQAEGPQQ